jgi:hypothetical protein
LTRASTRRPHQTPQDRKASSSFFKKRTKKLFSVLSRTHLTNVFCFFFSKKKAFLP